MEHVVAAHDSLSDVKSLDFGCIPVDSVAEKCISVTNNASKSVEYHVSLTYVLDTIDRVFAVTVTSGPIQPGDTANVVIVFKPNVVGQSFTEYYVIDDTVGNSYRVTVTGRCFGPEVSLNKKKLKFIVFKHVSNDRKKKIILINTAAVDTTYQWLLPNGGHSYFQISTGNCGLIRAFETITATVSFKGTALGFYTAELVCLILHQYPAGVKVNSLTSKDSRWKRSRGLLGRLKLKDDKYIYNEPIFLNVKAVVALQGNPVLELDDHKFELGWRWKSGSGHLLENNLTRLKYIPPATVFDRFLDFGTGSDKDNLMNISQTLCATNHQGEDGYIQWISDPDNIFIIDPVATVIPPNESRVFTVRFRPKHPNEVYGYLMCADYQHKLHTESGVILRHTTFRIPCIGNTWLPCTEWTTEWDCPTQVILPPTVPTRTTYSNFMLSNKLEIPMYFRFEAPFGTNFVVFPMCGIVTSRGWQIITVALEPKTEGDFVETWDLKINKVQKTRISFSGNAQNSQIEMMSHGYNPETHAMYEFPPTITGAVNYTTAYFHNLTRMEIHMRVLNTVNWLGADNGGTIVLAPKEILCYHWWFFPKTPDIVYDTTVTCSCVCLVDGRPVGEPRELFIQLTGFSEYPDLRIVPKKNNLQDVPVGEKASCTVTLYNYGTCFFTSKLYYEIDGWGDDYTGDRFSIDIPVNNLKPHKVCPVTFTVVPYGAGMRQINIKYTVLFRSEYDEIEEIQPVTKTIAFVWYDGIYPTIKIMRTISVKCPIILSNHCTWNLTNVEKLNEALEECRPNQPLSVTLYGPDLCTNAGTVEFAFIMGCVYKAPVPWNVRREKICECEMVEVQVGISTYTKKHTCVHRPLLKLAPLTGVVSKENPGILTITFNYSQLGLNTLCYVMTMPNQRVLYIYINILAHPNSRGILVPLRRFTEQPDHLAVLNCGVVPINNLDSVIRVVWLYNPSDVFTTWRLLRGNTVTPDSIIRCLLYFAEVPPLGKLAIPFAFMPTEMIDYDMTFLCSFGYDTEKIKVTGQGGLPNCWETRLDMPFHVDKVIRSACRKDKVYLSTEHITVPMMPTHSLSRDIICICNDTDHFMRYIWLPERIANVINIVMTPCWGVIQPKSTEWITMTVYTLQEPATLTTAVSCEILDMTLRREYQRNELLRKSKIEKCNQEFIITEKGTFHPNINDSPPYVRDLPKPQPRYLAMTVSISSKGQRDGYPRMLINQMWLQTPPYDLQSSETSDYPGQKTSSGNNMPMTDIIRIIDGILWDALHSKMFRDQINFYAREEIPTFNQVLRKMDSQPKARLCRRVTSGICDAIVNKAVFHVYNLNQKGDGDIFNEH